MKFMQNAILKATNGLHNDEVPVGAVIVQNNKLIIATNNLVEQQTDPTAHAEIIAIRNACQILKTTKLLNCDIYVTLEPCAMCAQAIAHARIRRLYFGAYDTKSGGTEHGARIFSHSNCHHKPEVYGGILEQSCQKLLTEFFIGKRN